MTTHARPLADWLAAASDAELATLFRARGVKADAPWQDFFDAAEGLLDQGSLARVLPSLTADEAAALTRAAAGGDAGAEREALVQLALLRPDGGVPPEVAAALAGRTAPAPEPALASPLSDDGASAHAAERAFTTVGAVADLLLAARDRPFALLTGGTVSAGEKRLLSEAGLSVDGVDQLLALAIDAGLARVDDRRLRTTTRSEEWLRSSAAERWVVLAGAFRDALPRGVRDPAGGWTPFASWPGAHPWDAGWPERSADLLERARLLGLIADDGSEPEWSEPLRTGASPDASSLARLLPAEVDRIFLQNDLSAISPGPLAPALDVRLRTIAARESAAQASSYRFTPESVARALVLGETEESILEFLGGLSLTGIPQPLAYLVARTAQRHGLVRVSIDEETGRTRIESDDQTLIDAMAVDQALRPLALTAHVASLTTRIARETVYWALTDARYPATLVDEHGAVVSGERHPLLDPVTPSGPDHSSLIATLRSHQGPDVDAAWLDRELDAAVRAKAVLRVTVGMPDGSTRDLLLEATGLGGGRLRGRDRAADVERTLPVSSIRAATIVAQ
ncbi:helicase-associated domain-containing protein [Streptomyces sp. AC495_CC817]|uniref:helicase-associated domain-containing protein n=1 Tax=Streptomyces sp. AC495_CC817 TaxID=2823900 RepID=UPI001C26A0F8|nr:helicase-associated domain-containing protein [Streptomyces sp. AC495_CC817]